VHGLCLGIWDVLDARVWEVGYANLSGANQGPQGHLWRQYKGMT
jgi:hypothetical protein